MSTKVKVPFRIKYQVGWPGSRWLHAYKLGWAQLGQLLSDGSRTEYPKTLQLKWGYHKAQRLKM